MLIHAVSPQDRARFYAFRAAVMNRERLARQQRPEPFRHPAPNLGSETVAAQGQRERGCVPPISDDLMQLHVTERWALHRFLPAYVRAREFTREPYDIVERIYASEMPRALEARAPTPMALELVRRVHLSVALLARSEGIDAQMPYQPSYPCPATRPEAPSWLLALLTGWP